MKGGEAPSEATEGGDDIEPEKDFIMDPIAYETMAMDGNYNPTNKIMNFRTSFYGQTKDVEETIVPKALKQKKHHKSKSHKK